MVVPGPKETPVLPPVTRLPRAGGESQGKPIETAAAGVVLAVMGLALRSSGSLKETLERKAQKAANNRVGKKLGEWLNPKR